MPQVSAHPQDDHVLVRVTLRQQLFSAAQLLTKQSSAFLMSSRVSLALEKLVFNTFLGISESVQGIGPVTATIRVAGRVM